MACGIGVCMTLRAARGRRRRRHPDAALLRRRPGVPRRPGALGRRRHGARPTRSGAPRGEGVTDDPRGDLVRRRRRRRGRAPDVDMSDLARRARTCPARCSPPAGCAAAGRELDQFFDITAHRRRRDQEHHAQARGRGVPTPRMAETPSGMLNSIGLQGPGIDAFLDKDLAWLRDRGARAVVSIAGGSVDEYAKLAQRLRHVGRRRRRSRSTSPAPTSRTGAWSSPATRPRPPPWSQAVRRNSTPGVPGAGQALARRHRHRRDRRGGGRRRRGRPVDDQHARWAWSSTPTPCGPRWPGSPAGCPARRSGRSPCAASGRCTRRMPEVPILGMGGIRTGLDALEFVLAGATRRQRRHGDVPRPVGAAPGAARAGRRPGRARVRPARGRRRLRPPARPRTDVAAGGRGDGGTGPHGEASDPADPLDSGAEG